MHRPLLRRATVLLRDHFALVVCALAFVGPAHAEPVSQWGGAGLGGLLLFNEPLVDLVSVEAQVRVKGDDAEVRLRYGLRSRAGERNVIIQYPGVAFSVEQDGDAEPPAPFLEPALMVSGAPVSVGTATEDPVREEFLCTPSVDGQPRHLLRTHLVKASVTLRGDGVTPVELRYRTRLTHDDWKDRKGTLERSARALCVRLKPPLGFVGLARGRAIVDIKVEGQPAEASVMPGERDKDGLWRWREENTNLKELPDVIIQVPPT